ncbi:hypothetical protein MC885_000492 [Smutsia gigantea]|nr:hypothetical protein MC885_000492 [Smutsia gigantea]
MTSSTAFLGSPGLPVSARICPAWPLRQHCPPVGRAHQLARKPTKGSMEATGTAPRGWEACWGMGQMGGLQGAACSGGHATETPPACWWAGSCAEDDKSKLEPEKEAPSSAGLCWWCPHYPDETTIEQAGSWKTPAGSGLPPAADPRQGSPRQQGCSVTSQIPSEEVSSSLLELSCQVRGTLDSPVCRGTASQHHLPAV